MSQITITIDDQILVNSLDAFIGHGEIRDLIKDMFTHNDKAKRLLGRLLLGEKLAEKPKLNQMGLFKIQGQWFTNRDTTKDTDLDLKGYLSCKVIGFSSYVDYSPIKIEFPTYDESGEVVIVSTGLDYDEFIWLEEDKTILAEF
jgi:hypothetical protein